MPKINITGSYFYGNKISDYGFEHGYVDYVTLSKAFDSVMSNDIISTTNGVIGEWELFSGSEYYYEDNDGNIYDYEAAQNRIDELSALVDDLTEELDDENDAEKIADIQGRIDDAENDINALEDTHYNDIFQYFIVSSNGAEILRDCDEIVYYNEALDMFVWCVTHWGTSWDYVLTNIPCNTANT